MQPVSAKSTEVPDSRPLHLPRAGRIVRVCSAGAASNLIGNTPLLRLERLTRDLPGIELLGKAEWYNPGDR